MAQFEIAYATTNKNEGGYVNDAADKGGETYAGITRLNYPTWAGWAIIDDLKRATGFPAILTANTQLQTLKVQFYRTEYWNALSLDIVNAQSVANELYDTSVNMGKVIEGKFLQQILNAFNYNTTATNHLYYADLIVDGNVGPKTIAALNTNPNPELILAALNCDQGARYLDIAINDSTQRKFMKGWFAQRVLLT